MIVKATFKKVVNVRPFTTRDGKEKYTVIYLISSPYVRRDGSQGSNDYVIEVVYDQRPTVTIGDCNDPQTYEFELYFRYTVSKDDPTKVFQHITCSKVTQVVL